MKKNIKILLESRVFEAIGGFFVSLAVKFDIKQVKKYKVNTKCMKSCSILFLFLSSILGMGQGVPDTVPIISHWKISNTYTMTTSYFGRQSFRNDTMIRCDKIYISNYVQGVAAWISCDSIVGTKGDDKKIIRMLLEELMKSFERESQLRKELEKFVAVSVDFSNHVPDIFRTQKVNCKWPIYLNLLHKYGYTEGKVKKAHSCSNK